MNQINNIIGNILAYFEIYWINILIALLIVAISIFIAPILTYGILKIFNLKKKKSEIKKISFYKPLKIFIVALGIYGAILSLELSVENMVIVNKIFKIVTILLVTKGFANMANPDSATFQLLQSKIDIISNKKATGVICRAIRVLIYIIAGFIIITELGYNLNGLAAGLGIGTAILALAVQDVAKNLLGGFTIITDKILIVGDFIECGGYKGNVEDITFRSTRIRTLEGTQVTIPNGTLANSYIVNYGRMSKRRVEVNLHIDWSTNYETLEELKERLFLVLNSHAHVIKDSINIMFNEIGDDSLNLYIYLYIDEVKYDKYMAVKGQLNEEIIKLLQKENIELSYPSQNINIKK